MRSGSAINRQILPRMRKQTVKIRRRALRFCDTIVCFPCPLPAKKICIKQMIITVLLSGLFRKYKKTDEFFDINPKVWIKKSN